jgi:peptidoglycan pentaglycine glycine transferase (the first glycine)
VRVRRRIDPVVRNTPADSDPAWDSFVASCPGGDLVQTTAWAATKRAIGLHTSLTTLHDGPNGEIVGGGLIVAKEVLPSVRLGYVARGPLVDADADEASAGEIVEALVSLARSQGVRLLVIQPPLGGDFADRALAERGFDHGCASVAPEASIRLDLTRTEDELLAGMSRTRRQGVRQASRSALTVEQGCDVSVFHRLYAATASRQGFNAMDAGALQAQWDGLTPSGLGAVFIARYHGDPVAVLWVTLFAGVVTLKLTGWDAAAVGGQHANEALHWAAMRWARAAGADICDWGGFDRHVAELIIAQQPLPEAFPGTTSFFKVGFGGSPVLFPRARWSLVGPGRRVMRAPVRWALASPLVRTLAGRLRSG